MTSGIPVEDWIAHHARFAPRSEAAHDLASRRRFTYAAFDDRITRAALWLHQAFGVAQGDRVAVLSMNDTDVFELQFACRRLGAIFLPLNWRLAVPELEFICKDANPVVLIHGDEFADAALQVARLAALPHTANMANGKPSAYEAGLAAAFHNLGLLAMDEGDFERARANIESGLSYSKKLDSEWRIANGTCDLGFVELGAGRLDEARERFHEAHSMASRMGWTENTAYDLIGFSALALAADELETAGKLLGQLDKLAQNIHLSFLTYAERVRTDVESELRIRIGEDRLDAYRTEGASLSMEAITALVD